MLHTKRIVSLIGLMTVAMVPIVSNGANSHASTTQAAPPAEITEQDLTGTWTCDSYLNASIYQQDKFVPGWTPDAEGLYVMLAGSKWTFAGDGDGTFSVATSAPNPVVYHSQEAVKSGYKVRGNQLMFKYSETGTSHFYEVRKISESQMNLYPFADGFSPLLVCRKT